MEPTRGETGDADDWDIPKPTHALPMRPRNDPAPFKLASYYDRDAVLNRLKEAFAEGRLDDDAFDQRMRIALTARTRGELEPLVADLPRASRPSATAAHPARFTVALNTLVRRAGRWRVPQQHTAIAYKGRGDLDLRAAELTGPVTTILAVGFKSTIRVFVPPGIQVRAAGAGISSDLANAPVPADAPVVNVRALSYKGTVQVLASPR
jgi:hypothetical protein